MALHRLTLSKKDKHARRKPKAVKPAEVPGAHRRFRMVPEKLHPSLAELPPDEMFRVGLGGRKNIGMAF